MMSINADIRPLAVAGIILFLISSGWSHPLPPQRKHPSLGKLMTMTKKSCQDSAGNVGLCMFKWDCISYKGITLSTCVDGFLFGACCTLENKENLLKNDSIFEYYNFNKEYHFKSQVTADVDYKLESTMALEIVSTLDTISSTLLSESDIKNEMSDIKNFSKLFTNNTPSSQLTQPSNFDYSLENIFSNVSLTTSTYVKFDQTNGNEATTISANKSIGSFQNHFSTHKTTDENSYDIKIIHINGSKRLNETIYDDSMKNKIPNTTTTDMGIKIFETNSESSNNLNTVYNDQIQTQLLTGLNATLKETTDETSTYDELFFDMNNNITLTNTPSYNEVTKNAFQATTYEPQNEFFDELHRVNYNSTFTKTISSETHSTYSPNYETSNGISDITKRNSNLSSMEDIYSEWLTSTKYMSSSLLDIIKQLTLSTISSLNPQKLSSYETSTHPFVQNNAELRNTFSILKSNTSEHAIIDDEAITKNHLIDSEVTTLKEENYFHQADILPTELNNFNNHFFNELNHSTVYNPVLQDEDYFTKVLNLSEINKNDSQTVLETSLNSINGAINSNVSSTDYLNTLPTVLNAEASTILETTNSYLKHTVSDTSKDSTLELELVHRNTFNAFDSSTNDKYGEIFSAHSDITSLVSASLFDENGVLIQENANTHWVPSTRFLNVFEIVNNHAAKSSTQSLLKYNPTTYNPHSAEGQKNKIEQDTSKYMKTKSDLYNNSTEVYNYTVIPQYSVYTMDSENNTISATLSSIEHKLPNETESVALQSPFSEFQTPSQNMQFEATDRTVTDIIFSPITLNLIDNSTQHDSNDMYLKTEYKNITDEYFDELNTLASPTSELTSEIWNLDEDIKTVTMANLGYDNVDLSTVYSSYSKNNLSTVDFVFNQSINEELYTFNQTTISEQTLFSALYDQNSSFVQPLQINSTSESLLTFNTTETTTSYQVPITTSSFNESLSINSTSEYNNVSFLTENIPIVNISEMVFLNISSNEIVSENTSKPFTSLESSTTGLTKPTDTPHQWNYKKDCGVRLMKPIGRIVGGKNTHFGKWPWQALVKETTWLGLFVKNKCGGVLITSKYVLTAAHCQPGFLASLVVVLGIHDLGGTLDSKASIIRNVRRMVIHRHYNAQTFENDLALLEMESSVEFLPHIVPICLPHRNEDFTGKMAFVTGWGKLTHGGDVPNILQEVQVPIVKNGECQRMFFYAGHKKAIRSNFVCAGYTNGGQDSCEGDSGGPLMVQRSDKRWVLVGTVSHGIGCADPNLPGVYMRMSSYRPWIDSIIKK